MICSNVITEDIKTDVIHMGLSDHTAQLCTINIHMQTLLAAESRNKVHYTENTDEAYNILQTISTEP